MVPPVRPQPVQVRTATRGPIGEAKPPPPALTPGRRRVGAAALDGLATPAKTVVHGEVERPVTPHPHLRDVGVVPGRVEPRVEVQLAPRASGAPSVVKGDPRPSPVARQGGEVCVATGGGVHPGAPTVLVAAQTPGRTTALPAGSGPGRAAGGTTSPTIAATARPGPKRTAAGGVATKVATRKATPGASPHAVETAQASVAA